MIGLLNNNNNDNNNSPNKRQRVNNQLSTREDFELELKPEIKAILDPVIKKYETEIKHIIDCMKRRMDFDKYMKKRIVFKVFWDNQFASYWIGIHFLCHDDIEMLKKYEQYIDNYLFIICNPTKFWFGKSEEYWINHITYVPKLDASYFYLTDYIGKYGALNSYKFESKQEKEKKNDDNDDDVAPPQQQQQQQNQTNNCIKNILCLVMRQKAKI